MLSTNESNRTSKSDRTVLICQNTTCRKTGAAKVLAAFRVRLSDQVVLGCGCLGHCGNGPMVLIMPDQAWYYQVHPDQVSAIVQRHLPLHSEN